MHVEESNVTLPPLRLADGSVLARPRTRVWSAGRRGMPVVLLVHALTGSARAGGDDGWWGPLIGPGRPFDTTRFRIVCLNNLGSVSGASSPTDADWPVGARVTAADQARFLRSALDVLGVDVVSLVAGGSLGGGVALELAAQDPGRVPRVWLLAATAQATPWVKAWNHVQRAIVAATTTTGDPGRGLELARQIAMLTYRAAPGLQQTQHDALGRIDGAQRSRVAGWLEHQGRKLRGRFTVDSYLAQLDAMDSVDVEVDAVRASVLVTAIDTDVLYPPDAVYATAASLRRAQQVETTTISHPHGHDAFLLAFDALAPLAARALALPAAPKAARAAGGAA